MSRKNENEMVVALDIGTSKVLVVVGEINAVGKIEIVGIGSCPSTGLRRGVVSDIESTVQSIQRAVEDAELMAQCRVYSVYVGIAGAHINSFNSHGVVAIHNKEVDSGDVDRVIDAAKAINIPNDQEILHVLPQEYIIDHQDEITVPLGMCGVRLEAKVHMITGAVSAAQNITKCVERCGLMVDDIVLEQLASSEAVLNDDERSLGVCMIDIGGGTTDIAVFHNGTIKHTAVIPIAGDQITSDIAIALQTPKQAADELKKKYGSAMVSLVSSEDVIEAQSIAGKPSRELSRYNLAEVIEPRMEEIFELAKSAIIRSGFEDLVTSIVITGGSSKIEGAVPLAEGVFEKPVRLGVPNYSGGLSETVKNPIYATAVGLVHFGLKSATDANYRSKQKKVQNSIFQRMKDWFKSN